jgi:Icc-related predicted phosphoesterase
MRLVFISDTHTLHYGYDIPDGDVLVHSGDFMNTGKYEDEFISFLNFYSGFSYKHKIVIPGNHDFWAEKYPEDVEKKFKEFDIDFLIQKTVTVDDIKFYGDPYQPWFYDWAFNLPRGKILEENWKKIPDDTDVLITHTPPRGILDRVKNGGSVGCSDLMNRIDKLNIKINAFGHIHEAYGTHEENGVLYVNASICDERYRPINKPIVVDIEKENGVKNVRLVS